MATTEEVFVENEKRDNWWIYAILLTIIGLGALLLAFL
jgi:hypothetical protein